MKKSMGNIQMIIASKLALRTFYVLFVILAARIAFTRVFPLPYDESFHFGLIQLYTHHLNPFLVSQPTGANVFGAVARDPSYLYHYLMSFPLRLISIFAHTTLEQVISLRLIDISFGVWTLHLLRQLGSRFGLSPLTANLTVLMLALTPIFYDVSGQINYDTLLMPLTLLTIRMVWDRTEHMKHGNAWSWQQLSPLIIVLLLTSLVKYTFLPIMVTVICYVSFVSWQYRRQHVLSFGGPQRWGLIIASIACIALSGSLWMQRYGINLIHYHTPNPQCNAVLTIKQCASYGPWERNYELHQTITTHAVSGLELRVFTQAWISTMYQGIYSVVTVQGSRVVYNQTILFTVPLLLFMIAACYILLRWHKFMTKSVPWVFVAAVIVSYVVVLWIQNFSDFHNLGAFIAVQGRYLLPILPLGYLIVGRAYMLLFQDLRPASIRALAAEYAITTVLIFRQSRQFITTAVLPLLI